MRLLENGDKCPIHQTLMGQLKFAAVRSRCVSTDDAAEAAPRALAVLVRTFRSGAA